MKIKIFQVDAFASEVFKGNPAAVCPLESWPDDTLLQSIAEENNLSETAFFAPTKGGFKLRWFTPVIEVDLCGHATLAAAHVIFQKTGYVAPEIVFDTRSGDLIVRKNEKADGGVLMDFPAQRPVSCKAPDALENALGKTPIEVLCADDYLAIFESEEAIRSIVPDYALLSKLDKRGVIVSAGGKDVDFVSRFFAPKYGIPEDPVTGSAHCALTPYWADKFRKTELKAHQISKRGGELSCALKNDRVVIGGRAIIYMEGEILV